MQHFLISTKWKWSHVQTKDFIQHISINHNMKNKQKSDCTVCPWQIYPGMFICISNIKILPPSTGGPLSSYTQGNIEIYQSIYNIHLLLLLFAE